jgi:hypothetical protein
MAALISQVFYLTGIQNNYHKRIKSRTMFRGYISKLTVLTLVAFVLFGSCRKREGFALPDNYIVFTSDAQGISEAESSITIKVKLTRGTDKDIPVTVKITEQGAAYGTKYTTTPAATAGMINIIVPSGNDEASFTINKVAGSLFEGTEKLVVDLYSSGSPILIGTPKKLTLSFAELVATNSSITVNGGGGFYPNKVFIDLSANRQTSVRRTNWDLGFYTDAADFKVNLNSSNGMVVKQINKNDLTQVTAADTVGFSAEIGSLVGSPTQIPYVDYPSGDLTKTAIGLVAATAADNKVFIVNRGGGVATQAGSLPPIGWKKIRVLRNATGGYTLQHADIGSSTFSSIDIAKDDKYFFKYISFETGAVAVEPEKTKWDIAWTHSVYLGNIGTASEYPYLFQDIVFQNRNVQVAKVLVSAKTYEAFTEADIAAQTFSPSLSTIGSDWRTTLPLAVKAQQFYIIKDGNNNYYKLRFTSMTDAGIRGYPAIEYALVKRG